MTAACIPCKTRSGMAFECVICCVRWLSQMTPAEIAINAPVIERAAGAEQMNKVRAAWKARGANA